MESIITKLESRKRELKYEVDQLNEELQIQKDTFSQAEEKWKESFFRKFSVEFLFSIFSADLTCKSFHRFMWVV